MATKPAFGSNIVNFDPNDQRQQQLALFGQQWWEATTPAQKEMAAQQAKQFRESLGAGVTTFDPKTGKTTFNVPAGGTSTNVATTTGGGTETPSATTAANAYAGAETSARGLAESKVNRYMSEATDSINNLLNRLKATREQQLRGAELSAEQQKLALQNRQFLNSRAAQQAMTGRGLTGSGVAEDAQTRLALQGQQELSQLYSNLGQQRAGIEEQYRLTEEEKLRELQTLQANKSNMTEEEFQNALDRIYNRTNQRLSALFQEASLTGQYGGQRTLAGQQFDRNVFESDRAYTYQQARDAIADENWKKQFDENVRQFGLGYAVQEAQLTGKFQGQDTLAGRQLGMQQQQLMADLTGTYVDANGNVQKTTQQQQQDLANMWKLADETGTIPPALASFYGISPNMQTLAAKQLAASLASQTASQQNQQTQTRLDIWRATGKAPKGLEAYGVQEGTAFYTPEQQGAAASSVTQQAAEGKLTANQFLDSMTALYAKAPVINQQEMSLNQYADPKFGKPEFPTDADTKYKMFVNVVEAGYDEATTYQILSSLGITRDEVSKFMARTPTQVNTNLPWNQ